MPSWATVLLAIAAVVVLAPLLAWLGKSQGRKIKGGVAIALLGFGAIFDPPRRLLGEAHQQVREEEDDSGEPKDPEAGH